MKKIEKLTDEQAARLPLFRNEYLRHGTNTAPADRSRAEAAFASAYRSIGRESVPVIWVDSPLTASLAFAVLKHLSLKENGGQNAEVVLRASLRDSLGASLWASLGDSLRASLRDSLEASLGDSLWASLGASLGDSLWASLRDSLEASLGDSQVEPQFTYWRGQQDLYWIAFYKFCAEIGVEYKADAADKLNIMHEISLSCMWWYPRDGVIIACERPLAVRMDERERLHNDDGPAVEFRDGWKVYRVHGVAVPEWLFMEPARLTVAAIHDEKNAEVQRVMIERYGWDRYADECGARIVDHDERWGTLMHRIGGGGEPILFLRVINRSPEPDGTFRRYVLPVDGALRPIPDPMRPGDDFGLPQAATALNAVASTFGLTGKVYAEMLEAES
jgi:hypothetical protein